MSDHNLNRLASIIAEIVTALGIDVEGCSLGPGPDICALGDEAVAALKSRLVGTPSGRAEELITQLEAEIVKRDARIVELDAEVARLKARVSTRNINLANATTELAALKAQPSAGVVLPERDDSLGTAELDEYANGYRHGWNAYHDAAKERLNPCRAQAVPDGYVMVPIGLAHILMAPNARPLTARDARNALRAIVDSAAPSAQQEESDDE